MECRHGSDKRVEGEHQPGVDELAEVQPNPKNASTQPAWGCGRNFSVYLAGPINGLTFEQATNWRQYAKLELLPEIVAFSPMRGKADDIEDALHVLGSHDDSNIISSSRVIASRDKFDVMNAAVMLANFIGASAISGGTFTEYGWASANDVPIITVIEGRDNPNWHPMITGLSAVIVDDLDQGIFLVRSFLLPD